MKSVLSMGSNGVRFDQFGNAYVGQVPELRNTTVVEGANGEVLETKAIIDMSPTIIGLADLVTLLIEQNDKGKFTRLLGDVYVKATSPEQRVHITDEGKLEVDG